MRSKEDYPDGWKAPKPSSFLICLPRNRKSIPYFDLGSFIPDRVWERIKRDFQVAVSVVLRRRQPPASDVHLEGGKDQLRHWQGPVALLP